MPGPISDSYDSEFGAASNADEIRDALSEVTLLIREYIIIKDLRYILDVVRGSPGTGVREALLDQRQLRLIRFALNRAIESI